MKPSNPLNHRATDKLLDTLRPNDRQPFSEAFLRLVEIKSSDDAMFSGPGLRLSLAQPGSSKVSSGEAYITDRTEQHVADIAQFLTHAYQNDQRPSPEQTWTQAMSIALTREGLMQPTRRSILGAIFPFQRRDKKEQSEALRIGRQQKTALIMSGMSGIPLPFDSLSSNPESLVTSPVDLLIANQACEGLAILEPGSSSKAQLVSHSERSIASEALEDGAIADILLHIEGFRHVPAFKRFLNSWGIAKRHTDITSFYKEMCKADRAMLPETFVKAMTAFGPYVGSLSIAKIEEMVDSDLGDAFKRDLRTAFAGKEGATRIRDTLATAKSEVLNGHMPSVTETTPLVAEYLKPILHYEDAEYGYNGDHEEYLKLLQAPDAPLKPYYRPGEISVKRLTKRFQIPEDAAGEYQALAEDLGAAQAGHKSSTKYNELVQQIVSLSHSESERLQTGVDTLKQKLLTNHASHIVEEIAKMSERQALLKGVAPEMVKDITKFIKIFAQLAERRPLARPLRQVLFIESISQFPYESFNPSLTSKRINMKALSAMHDFVTRITLQETWRETLSDDKATTMAAERLLGGQGLGHAINLRKKRTPRIVFGLIPTKGPLMEFSGYLADACWASRYSSITKKFPNITSVLIVKNPHEASARFAGASLLIESPSTEGPLLIIRGLNPLETDINPLDKKSFMNQFTQYVRGIARKAGRKPAIVINSQRGDAGTNRMQLHEYMVKFREKLHKVGVPNSATNFNGYDITDDTYLL